MISTKLGQVAAYPPTIDLNEICFDHPGAGFLFQLDSDLAIVDRAAMPSDGCLVIIERDHAFLVDRYHGQEVFGVITHLVRRIT